MKHQKSKRPPPVSFHDVSNIAMVVHNETKKRFQKIIHNGEVKQWVGIGWVAERHAQSADYLKYPEVK